MGNLARLAPVPQDDGRGVGEAEGLVAGSQQDGAAGCSSKRASIPLRSRSGYQTLRRMGLPGAKLAYLAGKPIGQPLTSGVANAVSGMIRASQPGNPRLLRGNAPGGPDASARVPAGIAAARNDSV